MEGGREREKEIVKGRERGMKMEGDREAMHGASLGKKQVWCQESLSS